MSRLPPPVRVPPGLRARGSTAIARSLASSGKHEASAVEASSTTVLLNNAVLLRPFRGRSSQLALRERATAAAAGDDLGMRDAARTWLHRHEQGGGFAMAGYNNRLALGHPVEEL